MTVTCTVENYIAEVVLDHPPVSALTVGDTWKIYETFRADFEALYAD